MSNLTWNNAELLADAHTYAAFRNIVDQLREEGIEVTNATLGARVSAAIEFTKSLESPAWQPWRRGYRRVLAALA